MMAIIEGSNIWKHLAISWNRRF